MEKHTKPKVLILDDEKQFTEELSDFFLNSAFESLQANTAADGRKILNQNNIDLLLLDIRLPGISGLDILKEVKSQYPGMVVIIVSAHVDMETVNLAMKNGAFDYLRKPFRYIDLQIAMERAQKYLHMLRKVKQLEERITEMQKDK